MLPLHVCFCESFLITLAARRIQLLLAPGILGVLYFDQCVFRFAIFEVLFGVGGGLSGGFGEFLRACVYLESRKIKIE